MIKNINIQQWDPRHLTNSSSHAGNPAQTLSVVWLITRITWINYVVRTIIHLYFSFQMLAFAQSRSIYMYNLWSTTPSTINETINIRVILENSKRPTLEGCEIEWMTIFSNWKEYIYLVAFHKLAPVELFITILFFCITFPALYVFEQSGELLPFVLQVPTPIFGGNFLK